MSALSGLRVLDLSRVLAGPHCTQILADLGAEVWKIEPLWGDETRVWGPPFQPVGDDPAMSAYYMAVNRGKQSIALDLKTRSGQRIVRELAAKADILVENFKVGDLARFDLDFESLHRANPQLVYCSITGYGQAGPRATEPGYDSALQGITGIMSVTGDPDGPPTKVGVAWIDLLTGLSASTAILAAIHERHRSGQGQHLDISLFDVGIAALANLGQSYLCTGKAPERQGNAHAQIVPYGAFECADQWIMLAVGNDGQFAQLCSILGCPELVSAYAENRVRVEHREAVLGVIEPIFRAKNAADWLAALKKGGVPCGPVHDIRQAFADPQIPARGLVAMVEGLRLIGSPFQHFSRTPARMSTRPPTLGEHTDLILSKQLGLARDELAELRAAGVIK